MYLNHRTIRVPNCLIIRHADAFQVLHQTTLKVTTARCFYGSVNQTLSKEKKKKRRIKK